MRLDTPCAYVQPDRILPTRFWARQLIGVLHPDNASDWPGRCVAMLHLARLLWLFTGHTLGATLLLSLFRTLGKALLSLPDATDAALHRAVIAKTADTLLYTLTCDQLALQLWSEDFPGLPTRDLVPEFPGGPVEDAGVRSMLLRFMSMGVIKPRAYVDLPFELQGRDVAHVAVVMSLRGIGMVASAFGALHDGPPLARADGTPSTQHGACRLELNDTLFHWLGTRWSSAAFGHSLIAEFLTEPGPFLPRPPPDRAAPLPPEAARRYARAPQVSTGCGLPRPPCPRELAHIENHMLADLPPLARGGGRRALVSSGLHLGADLTMWVQQARIRFSADLADEIAARGPAYVAAMEYGVRHLQAGLPMYDLTASSKLLEIDVAALKGGEPAAPEGATPQLDPAHGVLRDVARPDAPEGAQAGKADTGADAVRSDEAGDAAEPGSDKGVAASVEAGQQEAVWKSGGSGDEGGDDGGERPWLQSLSDTMTRLWTGQSSDEPAAAATATAGVGNGGGGAGSASQRRRARRKRASGKGDKTGGAANSDPVCDGP